MRTLRYVILLSLAVALLAGCGALPPVFPEAAGPTAAIQEQAEPAATEVPPTPVEPAPSPEAAPTALPADATATAPIATEAAPAPQPTARAEQVLAANPLVGTVWEWAALIKTKPATQSVVPDPSSYSATFGADGRLVIKADCNNALATYTLDNDALAIQLGPVTRAACPPGSLSAEYLTNLSKVTGYMMDGGDLILRLGSSEGSMIFRNGGPAAEAAPPAEATEAPAGAAAEATTPKLVGPTWQWEEFLDVATGANNMKVNDPARYTVTFLPNGTAEMQADCNRAAGTYKVEGASLSIEVGPVTLAACGPKSLSEQFLINLTSAGTYMFVEGKLAIDLQADGGRMVFGAAK
jgi:heat shock protein HslJ